MKRLRAESPAQPTLPTLPPELWGLIASFLPVADFQALLRTLAEADGLDLAALKKRDDSDYSQQARAFLARWQVVMQQHFPVTHRHCVLIHLKALHRATSFSLLHCVDGEVAAIDHNHRTVPDLTPLDRALCVQRLCNNALYPILYFVRRDLCTRCRATFHTSRYMSGRLNAMRRALCVCQRCDNRMSSTMHQAPLDLGAHQDGYAWIGAEQMKRLCAVKPHTKAGDFAQERGIRTSCDRSQSRAQRKEYYLLMDVLPYVKLSQ